MASSGIEVARAYVTIVPSLEGSQQTISNELIPAADSAASEAGKKAGTSMSSSFSSTLASVAGGIGKAAAAVLTTALAAATTATTALVKGTADLAAHGDEIDKMSQKVGLSAAAYQEWDYILNISGTEMSKMTVGLKTLTNKLDDAKNGSKDAQDMFAALGLSMEDLSSMSREDLFAEVIEGFQGMEDSTERAALANDLFGKSGQDLTPLFNTTVEETEELRETYAKLGSQLSDETVKASAQFQDNLTNLQGAITGVKNSIFSQALPGLNGLMEGFTGLITGEEGAEEALKEGFSNMLNIISDIVGQVLVKASEFIPSLINIISGSLPTFITMGISILTNIVDGILKEAPNLIKTIMSLLPQLLKAVADIFKSLIQAVVTGLPTILKAFTDMLPTIISSLLTNLVEIVEAIVEAIPDVLVAIIEALTVIVEMLPDIIQMIIEILPGLLNTIVEALIGNLDIILDAILQLTLAILEALPEILIMLVDVLPGLVLNFVDAIMASLPDILVAIVNLVGQIVLKLPEILLTIAEQFLKLFGFDIPLIILNAFSSILKALIDGLTAMFEKVAEFEYIVIDSIAKWLAEIITDAIDFWSDIFDKVKTFFSDLISDVKDKLNTIFTNVSTVFTNLLNKAKEIFNNIKTAITTPIEAAKTTITNIFNTIKTSVTNVINNIKTTVTNVFNAIKTAITSPIETAKNLVSNAVQTMKNIFSGAWPKPSIKLPHFKITGSFSVAPPSVPHLSIDWYAKGYNEAQILKGATIFGMNTSGDLLAGGERGPEVVVGESHLIDLIKDNVKPTQPIVVNVYGAEGQDEETLAQKVIEKIQDLTDSKEVVYA